MKKLLTIILAAILIPNISYAAMNTATITADGTTCLTPAIKGTSGKWEATVIAKGTWGSGTITWKVKTGTTYIAMKDLTGVVYTSTSDDIFDISLGKANKGGSNFTDLEVCAVMAGSTSPSLTFELRDNN